MIPFLKHLWQTACDDEVAVRRWLRGGLLLISTSVAQVAHNPQVHTWKVKEWAISLGIATMAGLAGLINLGEINPTDERK